MLQFSDKDTFRSRIWFAVLLMAMVLLVGVLGYMFISDFPPLDALYMTVITMTTIGYHEVHALDDGGKIFTMLLAITSIGFYGYAITIITRSIVDGTLMERYKYNATLKKIRKLEDHIIICGIGRNGRQSAIRLRNYKKPFVIIERNVEKIKQLQEILDFTYLNGDATDDNVLRNAGIEKASALITTLPSDADNLFVVLTARQCNPQLKIISRASNENSDTKLKLAGANNVIMPDMLGGEHMASLVVTPDVIEFLNNLTLEDENGINIEEVPVQQLPNQYHGQSIRNMDIRKKTGCTVIGFKNQDNRYTINPDADVALEEDSKLIILGKVEQIQTFNATFDIDITKL